MKKIVRLTESDISRLVRKIIREQEMRGDEFHYEQFDVSKNMLMLRGANQITVEKIISKLPEKIVFLAIVDCENADFSNIDICSFPNLEYVNLKGTPNNFEEVVDCGFEEIMDGLYVHK